MKPKDKAEYIRFKFATHSSPTEVMNYRESVACASICVNEILQVFEVRSETAETDSREWTYWKEVKQEVEKL